MIPESENDGRIMESQTKYSLKDIKKNDVVRFKRHDNENLITGRILSRAGKANGKYKHHWNVEDLQTGHKQSENLEEVTLLEQVSDEVLDNRDNEVETYMVTIPY